MKKIIILPLIVLFEIIAGSSAYAVNRLDMVAGARLYSNLTNTYNVTNVVINAGGTQIGSTLSPSLLSKIQKAISDIEKMKMRLKR